MGGEIISDEKHCLSCLSYLATKHTETPISDFSFTKNFPLQLKDGGGMMDGIRWRSIHFSHYKTSTDLKRHVLVTPHAIVIID